MYRLHLCHLSWSMAVLQRTNFDTEDTQITIGNTAALQDVQIGFELVDGTNVFTLGVDDSDSDSFKMDMLASCGITEDELKNCRKSFKKYRDKFIAHLDS